MHILIKILNRFPTCTCKIMHCMVIWMILSTGYKACVLYFSINSYLTSMPFSEWFLSIIRVNILLNHQICFNQKKSKLLLLTKEGHCILIFYFGWLFIFNNDNLVFCRYQNARTLITKQCIWIQFFFFTKKRNIPIKK